jgi:hypothetical protein
LRYNDLFTNGGTSVNQTYYDCSALLAGTSASVPFTVNLTTAQVSSFNSTYGTGAWKVCVTGGYDSNYNGNTNNSKYQFWNLANWNAGGAYPFTLSANVGKTSWTGTIGVLYNTSVVKYYAWKPIVVNSSTNALLSWPPTGGNATFNTSTTISSQSYNWV